MLLASRLGRTRAAAAAAGAATGLRTVTTATLPDLPYAYDALEPVISAEIMELHHQKHHAAYVKGMNEAQEAADAATAAGDLKALLALHPKLRFNGGGHLNHSMFWKMLCPPDEAEPPAGALADALAHDFGGLDALVPRFNAAAAGVQGSGWAWLGYSCDMGRLVVTTTANQDPLEPLTGLIPVVGVDVWEHAYYLQYKNARADYLKEVWKVVNWREAGRRYQEAGGA